MLLGTPLLTGDLLGFGGSFWKILCIAILAIRECRVVHFGRLPNWVRGSELGTECGRTRQSQTVSYQCLMEMTKNKTISSDFCL
jgi:hypothetical protein